MHLPIPSPNDIVASRHRDKAGTGRSRLSGRWILVSAALAVGTLSLDPQTAASTPAEAEALYKVRQTVTLSALDAAAHDVKWWVSIPDDNPDQEVLDLRVVSAPGAWKIVREPENGNRFLYVQATDPGAESLDAVVEFTLRRRGVSVQVDPDRVGRLDDSQRNLFARELRLDAPHMEVTEPIRAMADQVCGDETNIGREAALLLTEVAQSADHYSKDPTKPSCGVGDATACTLNGGGCCTDLHSLFIAMARARGSPARLQMGYRLLAKNVGKEIDPGYRCWAEYFVPGYGWVPADIVEADAPGGLGMGLWFSGLTVERLWLNQGRELLLDSGDDTRRVNHMSIAYAEVDGVPARILPEGELAPQITRKIVFDRLAPESMAALLTAK